MYHTHTHARTCSCLHTHAHMYALTCIQTKTHTTANPTVSPQAETVEAQVGHQAELAVFVSTINGSLPENTLRWYWPSGEEVLSTDPRATFQTSKRRLILSGLTTNDSGSYVCKALNSSAAIQLNIFGEFFLHVCVLVNGIEQSWLTTRRQFYTKYTKQNTLVTVIGYKPNVLTTNCSLSVRC